MEEVILGCCEYFLVKVFCGRTVSMQFLCSVRFDAFSSFFETIFEALAALANIFLSFSSATLMRVQSVY